jgi:hypothetical protein
VAAKSVHPATGIQVQIDELDALLDRLLQLPLGAAPVFDSPVIKLAETESSIAEASDAWLDEPILPFASEGMEDAKSSPRSAPRLALLATNSLAASDAPSMSVAPDPAADQALASGSAPIENRITHPQAALDPEQIPWIDDEPRLQAETRLLDHPVPESKLASRLSSNEVAVSPPDSINSGARVEIIIGPTRTVLGTPSPLPPLSAPPSPTWLRRLFWYWTWGFDRTLGRVVPRLRHPLVKQFLGFVGLGLLAGSAYLAWMAWGNPR